MTITFLGHGYVGLVSAAIFADLGNTVWVIGHTKEKIENLKKGIIPIYEPGLEELVRRNVSAKRLLFTLSYDRAIPESQVVFIAVGTPPKPTGEADLSAVYEVAKHIGSHLKGYSVVVTKSTVPVGTNKEVQKIINSAKPKDASFDVASVPEFLREGQAISDTLHPDRIVIGTDTKKARDVLVELHKPIDGKWVLTTIETAEMIKYAANAFLATKISFANSIARLSELTGADGLKVLEGVGLDKRVGSAFLFAGAGYGGSCFESEETVFSLNSPNVATQRIDALFTHGGNVQRGDTIDFTIPSHQQILAFDLETAKPTVTNVRALTKRQYSGVMVTIQTSMGRSLRVTADHPVILYQNQTFTIVPAALVVPGDHIMALSTLPPLKQAKTLNLLRLLQGTDLENDVYVSAKDNEMTKQYTTYRYTIPEHMLKYPEEIKRNNRMSLRLFRYLTEIGVIAIPEDKLSLYTAKGAATKIHALISLDAHFLRLCGYYIAEGYISKDTGRKGSVRERIGFSFHENEREYITDTQHILKRLGLKFKERHGTHATTTVVSSRIFAWLLRDVLHCGINSSDKALPRLAFNVSATLKEELLRGAFSGDGAVTTLHHGKNFMFEYATTSKLLADGMLLLLQSIGIIPSLRERFMNKSKHKAYILRVSGFHQLRRMRMFFGKKHNKKISAVLNGYQRRIAQHGFKRYESFATLSVLKVFHETVDTTVYSMETDTGTVITSSGLISHNCFPKDVKALIAIAKQYGYDFTLLKDVEEVNKATMMGLYEKAKTMLSGKLKGKKIAVLGLSFKPDTDDMRDAPSVVVIQKLQEAGAKIFAYDPIAMENAKKRLADVAFGNNAYDVAKEAHLLIVMTEWNEFRQLDLGKIKKMMKTPFLLDGRNIYDPHQARALGFTYKGVGR